MTSATSSNDAAISRAPATGAEALVDELLRNGVQRVFGYPGGAIMPVYDALAGSRVEHVLTRHEQGAALAAGGYARASGRPGVCLATSGPGATNLLTGIADAHLDSVPLVAITGQVARLLMGTDAFQEVDTIGMSLPVVKHSYLVQRTEHIAPIIREALQVAVSDRPGPVLIDLPKDVAAATLDAERCRWPERTRTDTPDESLADALQCASDLLAKARRPVAYIGGGAIIGNASAEVRRFVEATGMPAVTTLQGIGSMPSSHPQLLGMLGMHGTREANHAVQQCDLLICLGARFDDRVTGKLDTFAPDAAVVHIDVDAAELGKLRRPTAAVRGDLRTVLAQWQSHDCDFSAWCALAHRQRGDVGSPPPSRQTVHAPSFLRRLTERDPDRWTITADVGQHQMWVAQHCRFARARQHLSSGGLGTMGFGIPAAIGAQFADPTRNVAAITGDGSFMMNVQELATIRRYDLPIKVVVLDNQCLGMVRQWQELFFAERYSQIDLQDNPDFTAIAAAFGIPSMRVSGEHQVAGAIERMERTAGPLLLHVQIEPGDNVWPLVPPGAANHQMMEEA